MRPSSQFAVRCCGVKNGADFQESMAPCSMASRDAGTNSAQHVFVCLGVCVCVCALQHNPIQSNQSQYGGELENGYFERTVSCVRTWDGTTHTHKKPQSYVNECMPVPGVSIRFPLVHLLAICRCSLLFVLFRFPPALRERTCTMCSIFFLMCTATTSS